MSRFVTSYSSLSKRSRKFLTKARQDVVKKVAYSRDRNKRLIERNASRDTVASSTLKRVEHIVVNAAKKMSTKIAYKLLSRGAALNAAKTEQKSSKDEPHANNASTQSTSTHPSRRCDPVSRLVNAERVGLAMDDVMLQFGPIELTVGNLWSLMSPHVAAQYSTQTSQLEDFEQGWLEDKVVEAYLYMLTQQYDVVFAYSTFTEFLEESLEVEEISSLLWPEENFTNISKIFFPGLEYNEHWTLLVLDLINKVRIYLDPEAGDVQRNIHCDNTTERASIIKEASMIADRNYPGLCSQSWPCIEPVHYGQNDNHSCGVIICLFAKCLCEGSRIDEDFDMETERTRMASELFGYCYDDIQERNSNVCKVCHIDDGESWLQCHRCDQQFHESCLMGVEKSSYFVCPY